jgi:hypothetical protein
VRPGLYPGGELEGVIASVTELQQLFYGRLGFGHPAGTQAKLDNMRGAWVTVSFVAADTLTAVVHNLDIPVQTNAAGANQPNVRWLVFRIEHSGTAANAASTLSVSYETGDAANITADSMPLRLYAGGARTVGAATDDVQVDLFVIPATD